MRTTIILLLAFSMFACAGEGAKRDEKQEKTEREAAAIYVDTLHLQKQTFNKQIVCNGRLRAVLKSEIAFPVNGKISVMNIHNGDKVSKGMLLAQLDTEDATIELDKAKRSMSKAKLDLADKLIGQGYEVDATDIPQAIYDNAKHTSGYNSAMDNLERAERDLSDCNIYAPFSGKIANVESKIYDRTKDVLCTLIDDNSFDVEFNILEAELAEVKTGQGIDVVPFIDEERTFSGSVTEINPFIDDKGQVKVRARVANRGGYLIEGMNVKLTLNREIANQYVVPKEAVVLRDGYNVVFRFEDGEAVWTYVTVVMSNIDSHLISGHEEKGTELSESDIIITSGNRNLADGVKVTVKPIE